MPTSQRPKTHALFLSPDPELREIANAVNYILNRVNNPIWTRVAVTGDYTVTEGNCVVGLDTTTVRTITIAENLPEGKLVEIKDETGGAGSKTVTVTASGSDLIDGVTTQTITTAYGSLRLYSDGANLFTL